MLRVCGTVDLATLDVLTEALCLVESQVEGAAVVDLTKTEFLACCAIRPLASLRAKLEVTQRHLVLAGARDDRRERDLRRLMLSFELVRFDAVVDFDGAARIHRRCRRAGVTPRGFVDCMIAAVAARNDLRLLTADVDLERVAGLVGLTITAPGDVT